MAGNSQNTGKNLQSYNMNTIIEFLSGQMLLIPFIYKIGDY
jgi:hypothetical protein